LEVNARNSRVAEIVLGKRKAKDTIELSSSDTRSWESASSENEDDDGNIEYPPSFQGNVPPRRRSSGMFSKQKLTEEEVRKTSRKYCCKDHCLLNLGTRGIRDAREKYFRLNSQDQSLSLQWLMAREEEGKEVPTRLIFRVQRQLVC
jgi:hypothetical protein